MATIAQIRSDILATLDASELSITSYPSTSDDDAYHDDWIDYNILAACADVVFAVTTADDHPSRADFMSESAALADGAKLPTHYGKYGHVKVAADGATYVPAYQRSLQAVRRKKASVRTLGDEYFFITDDDYVYFSAKSGAARAKVSLATFDVSDESAVTAITGDLLNAVKSRALSMLFPQGGDQIGPASFFAQQWAQALQAIMMKETPEPAKRYKETA